ncbi:3'-5' exonuclease [Streptomyces sp. NPDC094032]|uniref:3'-5' exonuclease n=1 Tax=Streptomyces sp. NPDC094032 TaxID=3155308 RepID=UPI00332438D5
MSGGERVNDYDASCATCGLPVPAGTGLLRHGAGGWEVHHPEHAPEPGPPPRGDHPGWHRRRLLALDIGTTGHRPGVDRIGSAALRGSDGTAHDWHLDTDLPTGTQTGTGSPAHPSATPLPAPRALEELAALVTAHLAAGELLVVWYAPHVLGTLHAELLRHGLAPLAERLPAGVAPVCDPLVLDRHADRYRPGGRSLRTVAAWYDVPHAAPGDPASDAAATLLVAQAVAACHPPLARLSRPALHTRQILWYAEQTRRHPDAPDWPFTPVEPLPWEPPPVE